jgi:hypothetical protein
MKNFIRIGLAGVASVVLAFASVPSLFAAELPAAVTPTKAIELFNGKDFSGWTFCLRGNTAPSNTFAVSNGMVHCTGQPYGYVRTETVYRDYRLTVEWRFVKVAPNADNTGVFVHVQGPDQVWPKCIENQGQYHHQGDYMLMGGVTCKHNGTPQTRSVPMTGPHNEKAAGEWNTYEIICSGDSIKTSVNGKLMNEITECSVSSGAIALQSEGGEFEVRKVMIEPLSAVTTNTPSK